MSTKTLDQVGRAGAFHHIVRRKAAVSDTGLSSVKDVSTKTHCLPLSDEGVFGKGLKEKLKQRKDQKEQLSYLLPEYHANKQQKRKFSGNSSSYYDGPAKRGKANDYGDRGRGRSSWYDRSRDSQKSIKGNPVIPKGEEGSRIWIPFAFQRKDDCQVGNMLAKMEIPVGGRLRFFTDNWKKNHSRRMGFVCCSRGLQTRICKETSFLRSKRNKNCISKCRDFSKRNHRAVTKDVIEKVSSQQKNFGFYSTLFLVPKKSGKLRPVTNLRPLNNYLLKKHFKMDTLSKVLNVVIPGDWAVSIDLTDAYLHVPIFPKHRQFLRFCILGHCYQWKALCFGPTSAPRVYTKVLSVVMGHLHSLNIRILAYLDDLLILNQSKEKLKQYRETCINLLVSLGFIINVEKSALTPSQTIVYL